MLRKVRVPLSRYYASKRGQEIVSKYVDRSSTKSTTAIANPISHFPKYSGIERHMAQYHRCSPIRLLVNGGRPYFEAEMWGKHDHLIDHFQDNITIHSLSSDTIYVESIYKSHDFHIPGERDHKRRTYAVKTKYNKGMNDSFSIDIY